MSSGALEFADLFKILLQTIPPDHRSEAADYGFTALEQVEMRQFDDAIDNATKALIRDPFNPWALLSLNDAAVLKEFDYPDRLTAEIEARRLPGLLAAFAAGQSLALHKQDQMAPPKDDVWNMVDARAYVYAARSLAGALHTLGYKNASKQVIKRLKDQGIWTAQGQ